MAMFQTGELATSSKECCENFEDCHKDKQSMFS